MFLKQSKDAAIIFFYFFRVPQQSGYIVKQKVPSAKNIDTAHFYS
jgi:hypothetical protein